MSFFISHLINPHDYLRIPPLYAFRLKCGQKWSFGYFIMHSTTNNHFRSLWRHLKKFKKILISRFSVSECFFRTKTVLIIISSENAAKWCVTWPYFEYDLENAQFDHSFRNFIRTSGSKICWSPNKYFSNQCKKCFNLRYILNHLPLIFFFHIMTIRDVKQFLVVSRDSSIDKQYKWSCWIGFSTLSDKRLQMRNFNQNSPKNLE